MAKKPVKTKAKTASKKSVKTKTTQTPKKKPANTKALKTTSKKPANTKAPKTTSKKPVNTKAPKTTSKKSVNSKASKTTSKKSINTKAIKTAKKKPLNTKATKTTRKKSVNMKTTKTTNKRTSHKETQRTILEKELKGLLKKVDEGGLILLLKQIRVIIHNLEVDKINAQISAYESKKKQTTRKKTGLSRKTSRKTTAVKIEEISNGKSFFIELKNARKIFDLSEMRSLVKICHGAGNKIEAGINLHRWFTRNRKDVIADCGIAGNGDPYLARLYAIIIKTYKVKGK